MESNTYDTLEHQLFSESPIAMLRLDTEGRIAWANHALSELIGLPSTQLLGHTQQTLPSPAHRVLFNTSRLLHLEGPGAPERWLRCDVRALGEGRIHYFQDATREMTLERDNAALTQQLDNLRQTDEQTGLPNGRALLLQLDNQVSRSRRYQNPLSVLLVQMTVESSGTTVDIVHTPAVRAVAQFLRGRLRWVDQIARWGDNQFLVVLPETTEHDANAVACSISDSACDIELPPVFHDHHVVLHTSCSSWQAGDDTASLLQRIQQGVPQQKMIA